MADRSEARKYSTHHRILSIQPNMPFPITEAVIDLPLVNPEDAALKVEEGAIVRIIPFKAYTLGIGGEIEVVQLSSGLDQYSTHRVYPAGDTTSYVFWGNLFNLTLNQIENAHLGLLYGGTKYYGNNDIDEVALRQDGRSNVICQWEDPDTILNSDIVFPRREIGNVHFSLETDLKPSIWNLGRARQALIKLQS
jgi:hypothetical protein